ncbi:hypothetical protein J6590_105096, partial [Homalodisca vitripennis]
MILNKVYRKPEELGTNPIKKLSVVGFRGTLTKIGKVYPDRLCDSWSVRMLSH